MLLKVKKPKQAISAVNLRVGKYNKRFFEQYNLSITKRLTLH
ncbi:hypothetical protein C8N41_1011203 [Winogradskyella sediminis]|nr:hypothetical protein C8N41_1011203 [Winogradskyella sediminis]